jgi:hypothetical protein
VASVAGATTVGISTTLSTAMVLNEYADGWLCINDATGEGQVYQIKGNDAGTTGNIYLWDPLITALATTSEFTLIRNPFHSVVVAPTTKAAPVAGVPLIDVTAAYFFWAQVKGPAPLLVDTGDTVVIGSWVGEPGTRADAGACGVVGDDLTDNVWGVCMSARAATEYALVNLTLE